MCCACHKLFYITMGGGHFCSQQCIANTAQANGITEEEVRTTSHEADFGTQVEKDSARDKLCKWKIREHSEEVDEQKYSKIKKKV